MRCARALPTNQLMPAASSRTSPAATPLLGGRPGENERPHPLRQPASVGHPINHHVAGPLSVDPDKAGRRHPQRVSRTTFSHRRHQMT
jgi:hypothetical protein